MITTTNAVVFRGGKRRYFTLRAACMAEARMTIRKWLDDQGEPPAKEEWYRPRVKRLAGLYMARHRRQTQTIAQSGVGG
jgi:hypothetical protein